MFNDKVSVYNYKIEKTFKLIDFIKRANSEILLIV